MDDGVWLASVPLRRGLKKRVYGTFARDAEAAADAWMAEQVARLESGLEAVGPTKKGRASRSGSKASLVAPVPAVQEWLTFEEYALAWHHEQYVMLHRAEPERGQAVLRDLQLHILPMFGGPIEFDVARGRAKLVEWVRKMAGYPAEPGDPVDPQAKTYARKVVGQLLWIISEVYLYARGLGAPVPVVPGQLHEMPALTNDVTAMDPKGRTKRKAGLISFAEARRIAGEMHAIHQLVLWLMRVAGLRISESYGLLVANFVDDGEWGYFLIEAQGGRTFLERDENERAVPTQRKMTLKSKAGYRLIALPHSLSRLIRHVIEDFHTDPATGEVDEGARLIPTIRSEGGGAAGFRSALKKVSRAVVGVDIVEDDLVIPHDMRKGFATDLAWTPGLEDVVKRRAMGHRGGRDVFDLIYTLDDRLCEAMKPAAAVVEREIADSISSLMVPTTIRPSYSASADRTRLATRDAVLEERGWQVRTCEDGWVEASEAAAILSMTVTATRRLFPDQIPAVKLEGKWWARLGDVEAYRERFDGWWRIEDVVEKVGATYHGVYAMMKRLNVQAVKDDYSRQFLLTAVQADVLVAEFSRIEALHRRSMPIAEAAGLLGASHSSVGEWARTGKLVIDAESDASGKRFVTTVSVQEELDRRGRKRRDVISAGELKEYSGLDDTGTRALVARGVLVRGPRGGYTTESVIAWMTGYRPDLLTCGLIRFE